MTRHATVAASAAMTLAATAGAGPDPFGAKEDKGTPAGGNVVELITGLKKDILGKHDQFNEDLAKLKTDFTDQSTSAKSFRDGVDEKLTKYNESMTDLSAKLDELAQKSARVGSPGDDPVKSFGTQIVEHEGMKDYRGGRVAFSLKGIEGMKSITSLAASAGPLIQPQHIEGVVMQPQRRMTIRGLLAQGRTTSNAVDFVRELVETNNAAVQTAEGAAKAESDITYEADSSKVATIAHFIAASKQAMDDAPGLASMIDTRLRYGLNYKEELQLLKGDGTGTNLKGLITAADAFARPSGLGTFASATNLDVLRIAALQATVAEYMASGFVLNHIDWALIELTKDSQGRYIIGVPQGAIGATMWSLPVVGTNAMDAGNFLTGAMDQASQIFDREDTEVLVSDEHSDNFTKNMLTVRAEKRLTLVHYREDALITGTFAAAKAALAAA